MRRRVIANQVDLPDAVIHLLRTGELAERGTPGRSAGFRLMKGDDAARAQLTALWSQHGPALLDRWRDDEYEPWVVERLRGDDATDEAEQ